MAKNTTGTDVHVHHNGVTTVVHSGRDFPDGYEPAEDLTAKQDEDEDAELPGPSQFRTSQEVIDANDKAWKSWSVRDLRSGLGEGNYEDGDRRDVLIGKAITAGVDPASKGS